MKFHPHCSCCSCDLLRKMEKTTDFFAFLDENCPVPLVLDNLHEASKANLKCTCCILGNALLAISNKPSHWERVKNLFRR